MKITGYFCTECQSSKCIGHKNIFLKFRKKGFSMKRLLCWLGIHKYKLKKTKYPVRIFWERSIEDGTLIVYKCRCGATKFRERIWKWVIFEGILVHVLE